jgi:hypothetical protein
MSSTEQPNDDIPPWVLRAVERGNKYSLIQAIGAPFVRARSTAYRQLVWTTAEIPDEHRQQIAERAVKTDGDPSVAHWRFWASAWHNAHLITADWGELDNFTAGSEAARYVAGYFTNNDELHIGLLPIGDSFGILEGQEYII